MRYIKRILFILFLVIMISGCSVDYKIKINKDLSISDSVIVTENTDRMKSRTNLDVTKSVKYLYDIYKFRNMGENDYTIVSSGLTTKVSAHNNYKDFTEYWYNYGCDITGSPYIDESKDKIRFAIAQEKLINTKASTRPVYDSIAVTVEVPFKVTYNNADKVNGNEYTWYIKADATEMKRIIIEFNPEKEDKKVSVGFGDTKVHIGYEYLAIAIIIVLIGLAIFFTYMRNKKVNKM